LSEYSSQSRWYCKIQYMAIFYAYNSRKFRGTDPPYHDLRGVGWYDKLLSELPAIRAEVVAFLDADKVRVEQYFHTSRVEGKGWWGGVAFLFWNARNEVAISNGSELFGYFKDIPGIVSLSISILQPQTRVKGHVGDTDAIYRVHIPVSIPAQLPECGLKVAGITRPWAENDIIAFCDAHYHEAWNMTDEPRIVMILDVIKEELLPKTDEVCANILSSIKYQRFFHDSKVAKLFPTLLRNMIRVLVFRKGYDYFENK